MTAKSTTQFVRGTDNFLRVLLEDSDITFQDTSMYQTMGGMVDFLSNKLAIWNSYKEFFGSLDPLKWTKTNPELQSLSVRRLGELFKLKLYTAGIDTGYLKESHFYNFGLFALVLSTYPELSKIIINTLDGLAQKGMRSEQYSTPLN